MCVCVVRLHTKCSCVLLHVWSKSDSLIFSLSCTCISHQPTLGWGGLFGLLSPLLSTCRRCLSKSGDHLFACSCESGRLFSSLCILAPCVLASPLEIDMLNYFCFTFFKFIYSPLFVTVSFSQANGEMTISILKNESFLRTSFVILNSVLFVLSRQLNLGLNGSESWRPARLPAFRSLGCGSLSNQGWDDDTTQPLGCPLVLANLKDREIQNGDQTGQAPGGLVIASNRRR